jgi:hypothetical protein
VTSRLQESLALVEAEMPTIEALKYRHGVLSQAMLDAPPRIIWVPTTDQFLLPDVAEMNARSLWTRWAGVDAHIWGKDEEAAEELVHQLAAALKQTYPSIYALQMGTGQWVTQELANAGITVKGQVYVLSFALGIPVTREPFDLARVTDVAHEPGVAGDGVLTCDEE